MADRITLFVLVLLSAGAAAAADTADLKLGDGHDGASRAFLRSIVKGARHLMQYTGAVVARSRPAAALPVLPQLAVSSYGGYRDSAYNNPAVGLVKDAMETGQAPSDIGSVRGRGWMRGKIMGQVVNADCVGTACIGNNKNGGVTAVGDAYGQYETSGRYGYSAGQAGARAAAATTTEVANGCNVVNGAAACQAWGQACGKLPSGQGFYARGSAQASAEGTLCITPEGATQLARRLLHNLHLRGHV